MVPGLRSQASHESHDPSFQVTSLDSKKAQESSSAWIEDREAAGMIENSSADWVKKHDLI